MILYTHGKRTVEIGGKFKKTIRYEYVLVDNLPAVSTIYCVPITEYVPTTTITRGSCQACGLLVARRKPHHGECFPFFYLPYSRHSKYLLLVI